MGNRKHSKRAMVHPVARHVIEAALPLLGEEQREIFLGEGGEQLTDGLIGELVASGKWELDFLTMAASKGALYHRRRHSIIFPTESL